MIYGKVKVDLTPLKSLKKGLVRKVLSKAVRQAAKPLKAAAKANAQGIGGKSHGFSAKALAVKVKVYTAKTTAVAVVGPRSQWIREVGVRVRGKHAGQPIRVRPSFYAHLLERGSRRSRKRPYLQPAFNSTQSQFIEIMRAAIADGIAKVLAEK